MSAVPPAVLPAGLTTRPLVPTDARAVYELMAAQELADIGEVVIEEADIVSDWARPSFDLTASALGVLDGDRLVGYVEVSGRDRGDAAVHPDVRGRGLGTWLAHRMQDLARGQGSTVIGMPVPAGSPGDRLLEELGYRVRWTSWVLQLPEGRTVPARDLPDGYVVRAAAEDEHRACWTVVEDAFLEWSDRERQSFEDFAAGVMLRPGFAPWQLRVVVDPAGEVVAVAIVFLGEAAAYVDRLATRRDQRGRGLAQALLVDSFAVAREHGATRSELSTDSRTGALGLYEKVGMEVTSTWVNRAVDL
ncbi:GNAT family N-acetyltransferase [Nocardioides lianchengensis]|uniref:Ribosomal protein S18 acetylase RimI n=1 Tax=Nocardioides lianchengensis TaxID=1045774 RepID=A0A1G6L9B9_9ACTN|nr:GNAT family N-acetyltransferase [Nocardioides lianchengensis]NYG12635.1 GNAT superfamily N-acetyltransferase [Nocardioides lianchengensis]SDC39854.1 Ribosomal protein S18 acetylase RimI [Nocardioides lianchengensis]